MKKLVFMFVAMAAISFASCDSKKAGEAVEATADSITAAADSTVEAVTDSIKAAADSAVATVDSAATAAVDSLKK